MLAAERLLRIFTVPPGPVGEELSPQKSYVLEEIGELF
jgi:hypothetical protein